MFDYVKDKKFLGNLKKTCGDIINRLVIMINNDGKLKAKANLVGSGARNLIMQNGDEPVDLDYNLIIENCGDYDGRDIKEYVRKAFDKVLIDKGIDGCNAHDSKSALTTGKMHFIEGNQTRFSIDLAIIKQEKGKWSRLIHEKTGRVDMDRWFWNDGPNSKKVLKKVEEIKNNSLWGQVRTAYKNKKNMYLKRPGDEHSSFMCYIEAVNEVYDKHFGQK